MRPTLRTAVFACAALGWLYSLSFSQAAPPATAGTLEKLVRAALESERDGPAGDRARLLAEALRLDPNFAPARWHSGFVRIGDEWIKIDDVPGRVADDAQRAAYRKRRQGLIDTADNHRELARWCRKNRLPDEQRVHWAKVLEFDPMDGEALAALGLQLHEGRLMTRSQIERAKVAAGERLRAMRKWQPRLIKWRRAIERGSDKARLAAFQHLEQIDDPAAIPALEIVFAVNRAGEKNMALERALIETVGRMAGSAATQVLLRRAVLGDPKEVRELAINELKRRPMHAFVPQLIAALPGSLKTKFRVYLLPGGMVTHDHQILIEGRQANLSLTLESMVNPADTATAALVTPRAVKQELSRAAGIEARARALSEQNERMRTRIEHVLEQTTGFASVDDPRLWEQQYREYQGWSPADEHKPTYRQYVSNTESYLTLPTRTRMLLNCHSCFPAGTLILSIDGPRPIETILPGDKVLTQNVNSAELAYKPVQATTLRAPTRVVKISTSAETLRATTGHPFWVVGQGWRTAKNLAPGDRLQSIKGRCAVKLVEESRPTEVYNLVVSDRHNYFVGESQLLVHDNSPILEASNSGIGLAHTSHPSSGPEHAPR